MVDKFSSYGLVVIATAALCGVSIPVQAQSLSGRRVEIVLDASGSMNGRLEGGQTKIDAAKAAVRQWLETIPVELPIAFRSYGHQSPREKHDCQDTELLVGFEGVDERKNLILESSREIRAQGYTPITFVLEQAAHDFSGGGEGESVIVLVSDGKETCDGDACATAKALAEANASLVVHTVGFGVDDATQSQLECIARVTGGSFFAAGDVESLATVIGDAVQQAAVESESREGQGWLQIKGADLSGHQVTDAVSGADVGMLSSVQSTIELPSGIYNVSVGAAVWKSVEVVKGETTVLEPAWLTVKNASLQGQSVTDIETGMEHGSPSSLKNTVTLMPGEYDVWFGPLAWRIRLDAGQELVLSPGTVQVKGADYRGHEIRAEKGVKVGSVSNTSNWLPLPPGTYTIEIDGQRKVFLLAQGQDLVFER